MNDTFYICKWATEEVEAKRLAEEECEFYLKKHPTLKMSSKHITILRELRADQGLIGYSIRVSCEPHTCLELDSTSGWQKLTKEQQEAVQEVREHIWAHAITETELFYKRYPELRVSWQFSIDAELRTEVSDASN